MSAAVNRTHDVLTPGPHLPLTGEHHPLRREFECLLAMSNVVALTFALLAYSIIYFWPRDVATPLPIEITIDPGIFPSPPPIAPTGGVPAMPAVQPDIDKANFEPVDHKDLPSDSTQTEPQAGSEPGGTPSDGAHGPVTLDPIAPPPLFSVSIRFVLPVAPVYCNVPLVAKSPSEIVVPAPSGLFAPPSATAATLTVPSLTATAPVKLFVREMVSLRLPFLVNPVVPAILPEPVKV